MLWQVLVRTDKLLKTRLLEVTELKLDPDALLTSDAILCVKRCLDPALMPNSTLPSQAALDVWV